MLFFWTFYSSKTPEKMYHSFYNSIKQHNWSIVTLQTGVIAVANLDVCHHKNKLHFKIH